MAVADPYPFMESLNDERWLITGAAGQLGAYLLMEARRTLPPGTSIVGVARRHAPAHGIIAADLEREDVTTSLLACIKPTHILHLAGVTRPIEAERDPFRAFRLNVRATGVLADYAQRRRAWMLFASTDFVFGGDAPGRQDETAVTEPRTVYGRTKLLGEQEVLRRQGGCVARLAMLWGIPAAGGTGGWATITNTLRAGGEVRAVVDEVRTPIHFRIASRFIVELGRISFQGLIHIGGEETMSPYLVICNLRDSLRSFSRIRPVTRKEYSPFLPRPANAALDIGLLKRVLGGHAVVPPIDPDSAQSPCVI